MLDKTALVTGSTAGIGLTIATFPAFGRRGLGAALRRNRRPSPRLFKRLPVARRHKHPASRSRKPKVCANPARIGLPALISYLVPQEERNPNDGVPERGSNRAAIPRLSVHWNGMGTGISGFYDDFAANCHLLFEDWEASIIRQAAAIASILEREYPAAGAAMVTFDRGFSFSHKLFFDGFLRAHVAHKGLRPALEVKRCTDIVQQGKVSGPARRPSGSTRPAAKGERHAPGSRPLATMATARRSAAIPAAAVARRRRTRATTPRPLRPGTAARRVASLETQPNLRKAR